MMALFRRSPPFEPVPFGPKWDLDRGELSVRSGPMEGQRLELDSTVTRFKADYLFKQGDVTVGHCHFDRDPETGLEVLWDILVHPDHRGRGLSSLLVNVTFRDLLDRDRRCWFGMRKLMKVDTRRPELHNIGIGLISLRLGMRPEPTLTEILAPRAVKSFRLVSPTETSPPGLLVHLNRLPGTIVAARVNPDTGRPETDPESYLRFVSPERLLRDAMAGRVLVGNIDYRLVPDAIETAARLLADTGSEFRSFTRALRAGAGRRKED
jgi:GNAT superfamily N-acetyltransferase